MPRWRSRLLSLLTVPGATAPFAPFLRDRAIVFMLHRFRDARLGIDGHDPEALRAGLGWLRREGYELIGLVELVQRLKGEGPPVTRAVAFTIDDGYADHARIAAPVFAEFDCPVTTFVTTGFLDGRIWFWWDRIAHVFEHTKQASVSIVIGDAVVELACGDPAMRARSRDTLTDRCKLVGDAEKHAIIARLAEEAGVDLPVAPPPRYAPMSWSELRACETLGMTFAPHTLTHPILSRTPDRQAEREILGSWDRLREEARQPVPVFAYPNGGLGDFGAREIGLARRAGLIAGVSGTPGYAARRGIAHDPDAIYRIDRFGWPEDIPHLVQIVGGLERVKEVVRGRGGVA